MKHKLAIVGSGPAGLSAAARAAQRGMSHVLLEKTAELSDTIQKFQRGKLVMATPVTMPLRSDMSFGEGAREKVLSEWVNRAAELKVNVRKNSNVTRISGQRGDFVLELDNGEKIEAETVVMAIGTAGNPNRLQVPGAESPMVIYQLDDPKDFKGKNVIVVGGGDAGIENALGLADPALENTVVLLHKDSEFSRAKAANVAKLEAQAKAGNLKFFVSSKPVGVEPGLVVAETNDGTQRFVCDTVIARLGGTPPRKFLEACGIEFTGPDRESFPKLTDTFESTVPGLYVVGALAGFPLIKHCLNQGYDVAELVAGNTSLKKADEPILEAKFAKLPDKREVDEWLERIRVRVDLFNDLTKMQIREMMLTSEVANPRDGETIFQKDDYSDSLYAVLAGSVFVESKETRSEIELNAGSIFAEMGLFSGRRRNATVRAGRDCVLIEVPRSTAVKFIATIPAFKKGIDRLLTERMVRQFVGPGLTSRQVAPVLETVELKSYKAGEIILAEGDDNRDVVLIRAGSVAVSRKIVGEDVFLNYVPAGQYVGEMAFLANGKRTATVRANVATQAMILREAPLRALLTDAPELADRLRREVDVRLQVGAQVEANAGTFKSVADYYTKMSEFLIGQGQGEATDALIIDESLCVGCDQCEKACAEIHADGISRLDREAGKTFAGIHVPTSCRHCENPHCMKDCPPDAIKRRPNGEVSIDPQVCIGCGNCERNCPYGVIQMESAVPKKPGLVEWVLFGFGPGPGQPDKDWIKAKSKKKEAKKTAVKCDMCAGIKGGPACVRACPTGAAIRVSPEDYINLTRKKSAEAS